MSAGEVLAEGLCLEAVALPCVVTGEEENEEEESDLLVAAALSKRDAGVALLMREVGVALLLCFYSRRRDMCYLLSLLCACFHVFEIERVPSIKNIRSVSTMTTADSALCIFYLETNIIYW